uniref:NADH:flavin oxidoreductase/NADH oxidase N-terminal domain-containing protein n=1 Tax=Phytophthora ramorum TaxID=164328 RepID=H3G871_PHYRM
MVSKTASYKLFTPLRLGDELELKNRIVHGPATRARSDLDTHVPTERNAVYYEQRAAAGLIITEACAISEQAFGWYGSPALYTDEHVEGWKEVVNRVHKKGGKIFVQLWHMGRQSHPSFHGTTEVVSSSATLYETGKTRNANGEHVGYERARALTLDEIPDVVEQWRKCAERAKAAGFDGIEVHAAGGYLIDQFLQSCTNQRTDKYGGSFENRYRFLHEVIEAVKTVFPADRIGVRTAPNSPYGGMGSVDNAEMFMYVYGRLSEHGLAYLAILDGWEGVGAGSGYHDKCRPLITFDAKTAFKGTVMANKGYSRDTAEGILRSGSADLVGFARMFMANPDLVDRFQHDWPLNPMLDYKFFWDPSKGDEGYTTLCNFKP